MAHLFQSDEWRELLVVCESIGYYANFDKRVLSKVT